VLASLALISLAGRLTALRVDRVARLRFGPGQTYDFAWTPMSPGNATLILNWPFPTEPGNLVLRQLFQVR
jgi:hypothetical protein